MMATPERDDPLGTILESSAPFIDFHVTRDVDVMTVLVTGDVDILTVRLMRSHVNSAMQRRPARLVIDLNHVAFFGAAGLSLLLEIKSQAEHADAALEIRAVANQGVMRLLTVTGLLDMFNVS